MMLVRASCRERRERRERQFVNDAGVRKISIRASQAQRHSNQIVQKCHVAGRCVFIGTR